MGMELFRKICKENGIDADEIFILGKGSSPKKKGRYELTTRNGKEIGNRLYAVQYCKDLELYLAWNIHREGLKKRIVYSIARKKLTDLEPGMQLIRKNVEFSGWNEEDVIVFRKDDIKEFLEKYVDIRS